MHKKNNMIQMTMREGGVRDARYATASTRNTSPPGATAMPSGALNVADAAAASSEPATPVPARVDKTADGGGGGVERVGEEIHS